MQLNKTVSAKSGVRAVVILLIMSLFIISFTFTALGETDFMYGDVNEDGVVDVRDVVMVMQYILDLQELTEEQLQAADVNGDGEVDVRDVTMIMQYVLGIIDEFDVSNKIESVEEVELEVVYGTELENIDFPEKVTAILVDESEVEVDVEWEEESDPEYNPLSSKDYVFEGELVDLPDGIINPDDVMAKAIVTVMEINVPAYKDFKVSSVNIDGEPIVGSELSAVVSPSAATVNYQWQIADESGGTFEDIDGATDELYTPETDDAGKYLRVEVTGQGSYAGSSATSQEDGPVIAATLSVEEPDENISGEDGYTRFAGSIIVPEAVMSGYLGVIYIFEITEGSIDGVPQYWNDTEWQDFVDLGDNKYRYGPVSGFDLGEAYFKDGVTTEFQVKIDGDSINGKVYLIRVDGEHVVSNIVTETLDADPEEDLE